MKSEKYLELQGELKQLRQDNEDMENSRQTQFRRCPKCGRLSDYNYCCFYCGYGYDED